MTKEKQLRDEFGLSSEDEMSGSDNSDLNSSGIMEDDEEYTQEEFDRLSEEIDRANEKRMLAEENVRLFEQRIQQIREMSVKAKEVLIRRHEEQTEILGQQLVEHQKMLETDDELIEELKGSNDILSRGEQLPEDYADTKWDFKDPKDIARENNALRYKTEELSFATKKLRTELQASEKERENARTALANRPADSGSMSTESATAAAARIEKLQAEREAFRSEIKKQHIQRQPMEEELKELQKKHQDMVKGASLIEDEGDWEYYTDSDEEEEPAKPAGLSEAERKKYTDQVERLRAQGKKTKALLDEDQDKVDKLNEQANRLQKDIQAVEKENVAAGKAEKEQAAQWEETSKSSAGKKDEEIAKLTSQEVELKTSLAAAEKTLAKRSADLSAMSTKSKEKMKQASTSITKLNDETSSLKAKYAKVKATTDTLDAGARKLEKRLQGIATSGKRRKAVLLSLLTSTKILKDQLAKLRSNVVDLDMLPAYTPKILKVMKTFQKKNTKTNDSLLVNYKSLVKLRRKYFNQVQELMGNTRVFVRCKPMADKTQRSVVSFPSNEELLIKGGAAEGKNIIFNFDKVYKRFATQTELFKAASDMVYSMLDGFNVVLFAYGHAGSGKTFTMEGVKGNPGVAYRLVSRVFDIAQERAPDFKCSVKYSCVELSPDNSRDMLCEPNPRSLENAADRELASGTRADPVIKRLQSAAAKKRAGHMVMSLHCACTNDITGRKTKGSIHIVDLAAPDTSNEAEMKELQEVVGARDASKATTSLTKYLSPYLDGSSKAFLFVHVTMTEEEKALSTASCQYSSTWQDEGPVIAKATKKAGTKKTAKVGTKKTGTKKVATKKRRVVKSKK